MTETPRYNLTDERFKVRDRWVYRATLLNSCDTENLSKLLGTRCAHGEIIGVERFPTATQSKGQAIGLMVREDD
jgi:hypothetical protein